MPERILWLVDEYVMKERTAGRLMPTIDGLSTHNVLTNHVSVAARRP